MRKIAVFASGNGSNFENITVAAEQGRIPGCKVVLCVCDRPGAFVTERAARHGVEIFAFRAKDFANKLGFEKLIASGRIINLHPALLPAFPGAHSIRDAFEYGVKVYGITIHYVDETLDGGRIIAQRAIPYEGEDMTELEDMIHAEEHRLYPEIIARLLQN